MINKPAKLSGATAAGIRTKNGPWSPEIKQIDTGLNATVINTAPSATSPALYHEPTLCRISEGSGPSTRDGRKIQARNIEGTVKVMVDPNSNASNANIVANAHVFRVIIYRDSVSSGAIATWEDIFDALPNNAGQEYDFVNLALQRRFKVLVDKLILVPPSYVVHDGTNFHSYGNSKVFRFSVPLCHDVWFSNSIGSPDQIDEGNVGMFVATDASSTSYTKMKLAFRTRFTYVDY